MPEESPQQPDAKEELKKKLFEVREKRDLSAREVRDLADKNRANIDSFKKLLAAAAAHRKGRDEANAKVREAAMEKIPYLVVVGKKEKDAGTVTLRLRGNKSVFGVSLDEVITNLVKEAGARRLTGSY